MANLRLLGLSGSLRKQSYNSAALNALAVIAPTGVDFSIGVIGDLPLFNPDIENEEIQSVQRLKSSVSRSDGLVISSPEYAHGISGPMKNALDWLVGGEEFVAKPIMLINTSPRARYAFDAMKEVIETMSGVLVEKSFVSVPLLGSNYDVDAILQDEPISTALRSGLSMFVLFIERSKT